MKHHFQYSSNLNVNFGCDEIFYSLEDARKNERAVSDNKPLPVDAVICEWDANGNRVKVWSV